MKVLLFDLETSPSLGWVWQKYETDVIEFQQEWYILSFCCKWRGGKTIVKGLIDYPLYQKDKENDRELVKELWEYFNEADCIIAHNVGFDIKKANSKFIEHGLLPPSSYQTIDTLKVAQRRFGFLSNKLDDLGRKLKVGRKIKHSGFDLWLGCMRGDPQAWKKMKCYNKQDVLLLEKVYLRMRPWILNHPSFSFSGNCPKCSFGKLIKRGFGMTRSGQYQRYQCLSCGSWSKGQHQKLTSLR